MARTDADIVAVLEGFGDITWDQYFVPDDIDLVMSEHPPQGRAATIIEDDLLNAEVVAFLRRKGKVRSI